MMNAGVLRYEKERVPRLKVLATALLVFGANLVAYIPGNGQYLYVAIVGIASLPLVLQPILSRRSGLPRVAGAGYVFVALSFFAVSVLWANILDRAAYNVGWLLILTLSYCSVFLGLKAARSLEPFFIGIVCALALYLGLAMWELGGSFTAVMRYAPFDINPNLFGRTILFGVIGICYYLMRSPGQKRERIALALLVLLLGAQIAFTGSRKGLILSGFSLVLFLMYYLRGRRLKASLGSVLILVFVLAYFSIDVQDSFVWERTLAIGTIGDSQGPEEASLAHRLHFADIALSLFTDKPIAGWGLHQYQYVSGWGSYSHSNYLEILVNHGAVGLALYYSLFFLFLLRRYLRGRESWPEANRFLFVSLWLTSMLWDVAAVSYQTSSTWVVIAVLAFLVSRRTGKSGEKLGGGSRPQRVR